MWTINIQNQNVSTECMDPNPNVQKSKQKNQVRPNKKKKNIFGQRRDFCLKFCMKHVLQPRSLAGIFNCFCMISTEMVVNKHGKLHRNLMRNGIGPCHHGTAPRAVFQCNQPMDVFDQMKFRNRNSIIRKIW